MPFNEIILKVKQAFKANIKPGVILWVLMLLFFVAYATNATFSAGLAKISVLKISLGYPFSFAVYFLFAALLPEILKIIFFQKRKVTIHNLYNLIFVGLLFGMIGILTDIFYNYQALWFGEKNDLKTLLCKTLVDQGLYNPLTNSLLVSAFFLRENSVKTATIKTILTIEFALTRILPVVVAAWCVWVPGVMLVYSMPTALQLPVASLILCFWVLIFSFVAKQQPKELSLEKA